MTSNYLRVDEESMTMEFTGWLQRVDGKILCFIKELAVTSGGDTAESAIANTLECLEVYLELCIEHDIWNEMLLDYIRHKENDVSDLNAPRFSIQIPVGWKKGYLHATRPRVYNLDGEEI